MRVDWFTFVAQILNFVILVALLRRFLYRPVLDAIRGREESVRSRLEEAAGKETAAAEADRRLQEKRAELEHERARAIRAVDEEVETRRKKLLGEIREEVRGVRQEWRESLRLERQTFLEELQRKLGAQMYATMRRAMADLADSDLEDRVVGVFLGRLGDLGPEEREEFRRAAAQTDGAVRVQSAFPLSAKRRAEIERFVRDWVGDGEEVTLLFREDPKLALGIELRAGDRKIGWSVASYLDDLQSAAADYVDAEAG